MYVNPFQLIHNASNSKVPVNYHRKYDCLFTDTYFYDHNL